MSEALAAGLSQHFVIDRLATPALAPLLKQPASELLPELDSVSADTNALLIHLAGLKMPAPCIQALRARREKGLALFGLLYHGAGYQDDCAESAQEISPLFDHIFVCNPELLPVCKNSSYLSCALPLWRYQEHRPREPEANSAKLLHIEYPGQQVKSAALVDILRRLNSRFDRLLYAVMPAAQIKSWAQLEALFSDCDIFVDCLQDVTPGALALSAMAMGKTLVIGTRPELEQRWKQLENFPAVRADESSLEVKLEGLLRERRSMRDFGKRARKFTHEFCAPERCAALMLGEIKRALKA